MTSTKPVVRPGDRYHCLHGGLTVQVSTTFMASSVVLRRGQTVTLTQEMIDAAKDSNGASFLDLLDDTEAQVRRWGRQMIARGPAPEILDPWEPGSVEANAARDEARRAAWTLPTERQRQEALREVEARFGPAPETSVSLARYRGSDGRWARA